MSHSTQTPLGVGVPRRRHVRSGMRDRSGVERNRRRPRIQRLAEIALMDAFAHARMTAAERWTEGARCYGCHEVIVTAEDAALLELPSFDPGVQHLVHRDRCDIEIVTQLVRRLNKYGRL